MSTLLDHGRERHRKHPPPESDETPISNHLRNNRHSHKELSLLLRFYIFALHGYFIEVNFTAIWNFIETRDFKMTGNSSLWSLLIYGTCGLTLEEVSHYFRSRSVPIAARAIAYLFITYTWEFLSGFILTHFNACPWDYSQFSYNILGLITLEYAPFWLLSGILCERLLIGRLERLQWIHPIT